MDAELKTSEVGSLYGRIPKPTKLNSIKAFATVTMQRLEQYDVIIIQMASHHGLPHSGRRRCW